MAAQAEQVGRVRFSERQEKWYPATMGRGDVKARNTASKQQLLAAPFRLNCRYCFLSEVRILQNIPTNELLELVIKAISGPRAARFNFP